MIGFGFLLTILFLGAIFFALGEFFIYGLAFISLIWLFSFNPQLMALLVIAVVLIKVLKNK